MSYFFRHLKSSAFSLLLGAGMFICIIGTSQRVFAQECGREDPNERFKDVTVCSLLTALKREGLTAEQKNKALVNVIRQRGIKFVLTEDVEKRFRDEGANDALIAAINKESTTLEKTPFGYTYLGKKYLDDALSNQKREEDQRRLARDKRREKNEEEAKKYDEEADKYGQAARENAEKSIPYFNQAKLVEKDNENAASAVAYSNIAGAYGVLKDYDKAIDYATQAINAEPSAIRYYKRALLYDSKARTIPPDADKKTEKRAVHDKALADCEQAIALDSTMGPAKDLRAQIRGLWGIK